MVEHRSEALLVRVWLEDSGEFRARLLTLHDATDERPAEESTVAVAMSPSDVLDAVRDWLEDVARPAVGPVDGDE